MMDLSVGYHHPCHLRILGVSKEPVQLLQLIPGLRVATYSDKCCGMGGIYGLKIFFRVIDSPNARDKLREAISVFEFSPKIDENRKGAV